MAALLRVVDERFGANNTRVAALELRLVSERVTAREIIRRRVEAEVALLNQRKLMHDDLTRSRSLLVDVEPDSAEAKLNPLFPRLGRPKQIDTEKEVGRAVDAFTARRFIMLLDDRQIDDLDEAVTFTPGGEVVFLYITPLKGG